MQSLEIAPLETMHLLCDKLHIFESANEKEQRFLSYRTADEKEIIIIQQDWIRDTANDWITLNHMMIPTAFFTKHVYTQHPPFFSSSSSNFGKHSGK